MTVRYSQCALTTIHTAYLSNLTGPKTSQLFKHMVHIVISPFRSLQCSDVAAPVTLNICPALSKIADVKEISSTIATSCVRLFL